MTNTYQHLSDDLLNGWVDDTLTTDERATVNEHVAICATCADHLNELVAIRSALGELAEVEAPRSFRLTAEMAKRPTPISSPRTPDNIVRFQPLVRMLSIASIIAMLILGGFQLTDPVGNDSTPNTPETTAVSDASQQSDNGGLTAEGDAADVDTGEADLQTDVADQAAPSTANQDDSGSSALTFGLILAGTIALITTVAWAWMAYQSGSMR